MKNLHYQYRTHCFICQEKMKYYVNRQVIQETSVSKCLQDKVVVWKSCSKHYFEEIMINDHKMGAGLSLNEVIKYNICAFSFDDKSIIKEYLSYFKDNVSHYCFQHYPKDYSFIFAGEYMDVYRIRKNNEAKSSFLDLSNIIDVQCFIVKLNNKIQTYRNFQ